MENKLVKKSIFRQKVFAKRWGVIEGYKNTYNAFFNNIQTYDLYGNKRPHYYVDEISDIVDDKEIFICDIEMPLLEIGESFFIEEKNKLVIIFNRHRSSNGAVVYYVENEYIEDEFTNKSLEYANRVICENDRLINDLGKLRQYLGNKKYHRILGK